VIGSIALTLLVLACLALTVIKRRYESNVVVFLVMLAGTVYVVAGAINAVMLQVRIVPNTIMALASLGALGVMMYRRRKSTRPGG
jgi:hypothetical protein